MKRLLCKIGLHKWVYGHDYNVDCFAWFKRCQRCGICRAGSATTLGGGEG